MVVRFCEGRHGRHAASLLDRLAEQDRAPGTLSLQSRLAAAYLGHVANQGAPKMEGFTLHGLTHSRKIVREQRLLDLADVLQRGCRKGCGQQKRRSIEMREGMSGAGCVLQTAAHCTPPRKQAVHCFLVQGTSAHLPPARQRTCCTVLLCRAHGEHLQTAPECGARRKSPGRPPAHEGQQASGE